ncbi:MAG: hypothetical protein AAF938_01885 [Myxococcota bacterium]
MTLLLTLCATTAHAQRTPGAATVEGTGPGASGQVTLTEPSRIDGRLTFARRLRLGSIAPFVVGASSVMMVIPALGGCDIDEMGERVCDGSSQRAARVALAGGALMMVGIAAGVAMLVRGIRLRNRLRLREVAQAERIMPFAW